MKRWLTVLSLPLVLTTFCAHAASAWEPWDRMHRCYSMYFYNRYTWCLSQDEMTLDECKMASTRELDQCLLAGSGIARLIRLYGGIGTREVSFSALQGGTYHLVAIGISVRGTISLNGQLIAQDVTEPQLIEVTLLQGPNTFQMTGVEDGPDLFGDAGVYLDVYP